MSEPTNDGNDKPEPDPDQNPTSGSDFGDPTAPVWSDPTAPMQQTPPRPPASPAPPAPPAAPAAPGMAYPHGQQPAAPQGAPPAPPPRSNPYAQQPPVQQYGQPEGSYSQPAPQFGPQYGQPQPNQPYPAYGQQTYATGGQSNVSAIILTIVSALSLCNLLTIGSLVLGIVALTKNSSDPEGSRRLTKIGWIVFAAVWALVILASVALIAFGRAPMGNQSNLNNGI